MSQILFNNEDFEDLVNVLAFIDKFTSSMGIKDVMINIGTVESIVQLCKNDFPHNGGLDNASAFKQVANFACFFVAERPLPYPFPEEVIGAQLTAVPNHQNAMIAFALAEEALNNSIIERKKGNIN